ncbi:hypothetical protein [Flavobacterium faecale]|nr:hypothetical protein [Flavobacterium faecale]
MKKAIKIVLISMTGLACSELYSQNNKAIVTTETRKLLYYQVEEYVN